MSERVWMIEVPAASSGERLDVFLTAALQAAGEAVSRSQVQKMIASGVVTIAGRSAAAKEPVVPTQVIKVAARPLPLSPLTPIAMPLAILFEDEHLIVIDKPAGLAVHPGAGTLAPTLVQGLLHHCGKLGRPADFVPSFKPEHKAATSRLSLERPGIVHRLDKDTSGVLVCAKTDQAHAFLAKQFHDKTNRREYCTLLDGLLTVPTEHQSYLHRDHAHRTQFVGTSIKVVEALKRQKGKLPTGYRLAQSLFTPEATFGERLTFSKVTLRTGRTHQIRVHAKELGMPVWGDQVYGRAKQLPSLFSPEVRMALANVKRQLLHARLLGFVHPISRQTLVFEAPYPSDIKMILEVLEPYRQEVGGP